MAGLAGRTPEQKYCLKQITGKFLVKAEFGWLWSRGFRVSRCVRLRFVNAPRMKSNRAAVGIIDRSLGALS